MSFFKLRMIEVVRRIVRHPDLLHHAARWDILFRCEGDDFFQSESFEGVCENRARSFCCESAIPMRGGKPPQDLDARREMRVEFRHRKPYAPGELPRLA